MRLVGDEMVFGSGSSNVGGACLVRNTSYRSNIDVLKVQ